MEVRLIKGPRTSPVDIDIEIDITLEELVKDYKEELPYTIIAAKVNNKIEALTYKLQIPAEIELLDMRDQAANLIYQYSLSLIYIKAINDVLGKVHVEIKNSLNKGLFTNIRTLKPVTKEDIQKIETRMREIVKEDIPFIKHIVDKDTALDIFISAVHIYKIRILKKAGEVKRVKFYSLGDTCDFFYGMMVPSTSYIEHFELRKYKAGILLRFPHQKNPDQISVYVDEKKLYEAFAEETRWSNLMEVRYVNDLNVKIANGEYKELIQLSEAVHEKKIAEIANLILKENKRVIMGEDKNIFPYSNEADVLFNYSHIYELAVLKKYAEPLLLEIKPEEPEYSEAIRMLKFISFFDIIEDDSIIVNNSIIREFIGGSIFV